MDLAVAWYQEEQEGEAKRIWSNIWETAEMVNNLEYSSDENFLLINFEGVSTVH